MNDDDRKLAKESISNIAASRIEEAADIVERTNPSQAFDSLQQRRDHAHEFQQQALALLSDAAEALENGDNAAAVGLLKATTTYLEAIQDLLVDIEGYEPADMLGQAIETTRQAKTLLNVYTT